VIAVRLQTDRLVIRTFDEGDLDSFAQLLDIPEIGGWRQQRSNPKRFLEWHISNYTRMDIVHGIVCLGLFDTASGAVWGAVGAGEHDDLHETELFFSLIPEARGRGYAREAATAVTEWALAEYDIPFIIATVAVGNSASQKVVEGCGYVLVDERTLVVHLAGRSDVFRYYRRYRGPAGRSFRVLRA
jgi:RimJ/RimL family protein N-acetyltransferase